MLSPRMSCSSLCPRLTTGKAWAARLRFALQLVEKKAAQGTLFSWETSGWLSARCVRHRYLKGLAAVFAQSHFVMLYSSLLDSSSATSLNCPADIPMLAAPTLAGSGKPDHPVSWWSEEIGWNVQDVIVRAVKLICHSLGNLDTMHQERTVYMGWWWQ